MTVQKTVVPVSLNTSMLLPTMTYGGGRRAGAIHWLLGDLTGPMPLSMYEFLLWPFYLGTLLWSTVIAIAGTSWSVPFLIYGGVAIGIVGFCYPSRRLVGAALIGYWWVALATYPPVAGVRYLFTFEVLAMSIGFAWFCDWTEKIRDRQFHAARQAREEAGRDRRSLDFLGAPVVALRTQPPTTRPGTPGTKTLTGLRIAEVSRHFDSQLEASVKGMLQERTRYGGWDLGVSIGRFGLGMARGTGYSQGQVDLSVQGGLREEWANENFVAVLETGGDNETDVVRLLVPSDPSVHEYVQNLLWEWQRNLRVGSASELFVRGNLFDLPERVMCDASYVADRLGSILRMEASARPEISVVGASVRDHALLGGAIQFGREGDWYQLFPIALVNALVDLMSGRLPSPPDAGTAVEVQSQVAQVAASTASSNGKSPRGLRVSTVGQFLLKDGQDDVTNELIQKPVASFVWLYLLARTVRNPRDVISRAALADEVFPGVDPKQQRTRLRQRLSDLQSSLPAVVRACVVSDGERVRFNSDGAAVDAILLRTTASGIASSKTPLDEGQLKDLVELVSSVGDGMFLPEWEALEQKVTAGKGSAASVIEEARAEVDRWRNAVLIAVAEGYSARGRQTLAIPYLERVIRNHPEDEGARKKLVAAYLETGQTDRVRELQESGR